MQVTRTTPCAASLRCMTGREGLSRVRRGFRAIAHVLAVPLRVADLLLGVPHSTEGSQTVRELERLAAMRDRGELTVEEYRLAKDRILGGSST